MSTPKFSPADLGWMLAVAATTIVVTAALNGPLPASLLAMARMAGGIMGLLVIPVLLTLLVGARAGYICLAVFIAGYLAEAFQI